VSTQWVLDALIEHNSVFRLLAPAWGIAKLDHPLALDREGHLEARLFPVPGKVPGWLASLGSNHPEATTGVRITDLRTGRRILYIPGIQSIDAGAGAELEAADLAFVDGTFFREDELSATRPGAPGARAMGHAPITGAEGSLQHLAGLRARVFYTHLNNTNPVLDARSEAAAAVQRARVGVASDGMELEL
jgi:pyrroloquinoline quinone biosynthesis protein B